MLALVLTGLPFAAGALFATALPAPRAHAGRTLVLVLVAGAAVLAVGTGSVALLPFYAVAAASVFGGWRAAAAWRRARSATSTR